MNEIVKKIVLMKRWRGKTMQISPEGDFSDYFPVSDHSADFFDIPTDSVYSAIIGILPSVPYKHITNKDKMIGFDKNTNLYVFYIDKCLQHLDNNGELIVCTPSDFLKNAPILNEKIYKLGTITDVIHIDKVGWMIWRFVKGDKSQKTLVDGSWKNFISMNNQLMFLNNDYSVPFTKLFTIRVGAMSGCDEVFTSEKGNTEFVTAQTPRTGMTKRMFFNSYDEYLLKYKKRLLARRAKKFTEENWWMWGRSHYISEEARVYVPCKTKEPYPFFHHSCLNYDGSVLAIFFKGKTKPAKVVNLLNKMDWEE